MRKLELLLDERLSVRGDEVALSQEGRGRAFQRDKGPVPIPQGRIVQGPWRYKGPRAKRIASYQVEEPSATGGRPYAVRIEDDTTIIKGLEIVDARLLGDDGARFDATFSELRDPAAQNRINRVRNRARAIRGLSGFAAAGVLGTVWAVAHLPVPAFIEHGSCADDHLVGEGQFIERVLPNNPAAGKTCMLAGQEYTIRNIPPQR